MSTLSLFLFLACTQDKGINDTSIGDTGGMGDTGETAESDTGTDTPCEASVSFEGTGPNQLVPEDWATFSVVTTVNYNDCDDIHVPSDGDILILHNEDGTVNVDLTQVIGFADGIILTQCSYDILTVGFAPGTSGAIVTCGDEFTATLTANEDAVGSLQGTWTR